MFSTSHANDEIERAEPPLSNSILIEAGKLFDKLLNRQETVGNVMNHDALKTVEKEFELQKIPLRNLGLLTYGCLFCEMVCSSEKIFLDRKNR
jgi:hypothetical protein